MKDLLTFTFHSRHLVPFEIGQKGLAGILEWIENSQQSYRFAEGEEVCHKDNPDQKLYVKEILKEKRDVKNGSDTSGKALYKKQTRMIGIECYYWSDAKVGDTV